MNILKIDTSKMGKVVVELKVQSSPRSAGGAGEKFKVEKEQKFGSQVLLNMIEEVLKKGRIKMADLNGVEVSTGPGSFTGIRVGVSVANALGFGLGIPVNGKTIETEIRYT